jgi:hypothetical protein
MKGNDMGFKEFYSQEKVQLNEMANLLGSEIGLPVSLYFSPKPQNKGVRPIRFKVCTNVSKFSNCDISYKIFGVEDNDTANMFLKPVSTALPPKQEKEVLDYIKKHYLLIQDFWDFKISPKMFREKMLG